MQQLRRKSLLLVGWLLSLLVSAAGQAQNNPLPLLATPVEREIASGQTHQWQMSLATGQYIQIEVTLLDLTSLTGSVRDPAGATLLTIPLNHVGNRIRYGGVISFVAEKSGAFTLMISADGPAADAGRYEMKATEPRLATEEDQRRISAHRLWVTGLKQREPQTADARRAALAQYEEALGIFTTINDLYGQARTLNTIGDVWYDLANAQKFFEAHDKALKLWQALGRVREEGETLSELGMIAYIRSDYAKALDTYRAALGKHRAAGDVVAEAATLNRMGWCENAQGEKRKALALYEKSLSLRRAARNREGESISLNDIGRAYSDLGEVPLALEAFRQALQLRPPERYPGGAANILNRMGTAWNQFGEWQKALDAYQQSLVLTRQAGDKRNEAATLNNIAGVLNTLGDRTGAMTHFEQALQLSRETKQRSGEVSSLNSLGSLYLSASEQQKGLELIRQALEIARSIRDSVGEARALRNLGQAYQSGGEYQQALDSFQQSLQKYQALGGLAETGRALQWLAVTQASLGEQSKALGTLRQALEQQRKIGDRPNEAWTLVMLGQYLGETGELTESRARLEEAITLNETLRHQVISRELRTSFQPLFVNPYQRYIDVLMLSEAATPGAGFAAQAFQASERARARNLLELLVESRADIRAGVDPKLLAAERELQQRRQAKAEIQVALLSGKHTPSQAAALAQEIADISAQLNDVETRIRSTSPRYAALTQPTALSTSEIQQRILDDDTLLLEYALDQKRSYLWAVTTKEIHSFVLPSAGEIEAAARRWLELLPKGTQRKYQRETELAAAELSRLILAPAAAQLKKKRLVIVADGLLQYVPFAALPQPKDEGGGLGNEQKKRDSTPHPASLTPNPLILEHELVSLPSASVLAVLRNELKGRPAAAKQLAVFADPVFQVGDARVQLAKATDAGHHEDNRKRQRFNGASADTGRR